MNEQSPPTNNITTLLERAIAGRAVGGGMNNLVYQIPDTDYLLRVSRKNNRLRDQLRATTALVPMHVVCHQPFATLGENVGQALLTPLENPGAFSIIKKLPGTDLLRLIKKDEKAIANELCALPDKAWRDLFEQVATLTKLGIEVDFQPKNIIFDDKKNTLSLIDINYCATGETHPLRYNAREWFKTEFLQSFSEPFRKQIQAKFDKCLAMVEGIKSYDAIRSGITKGAIGFASCEPIKQGSIGEILKMSESPQAFVDKLQATEKHLGWQR
jgi:hypothetical protein